jgi:hypothetical protein
MYVFDQYIQTGLPLQERKTSTIGLGGDKTLISLGSVTTGLAIFSMALFTIIDIIGDGLKAGLYYRIREAQNAYDGSTYRYSVQGSSRSHFEDRIHEISNERRCGEDLLWETRGTMYSGGFGPPPETRWSTKRETSR